MQVAVNKEGGALSLPPRPAYETVDGLLFGQALHPVVTGHNITIGGGAVLPEVKFTLPAMLIEPDTLPQIYQIYRETTEQVLQKAVNLDQDAIVLEFEHLFEMTEDPALGAQITTEIRNVMDRYHSRYGIRSALRVTIADIREQVRPPLMRSGSQWKRMLQSFEMCAGAGTDLLSIESTGGKEVSDRALLEADLDGIAYALGVLAPLDMAFLWDHIVDIAGRYGIVAAGDTACGFGNTAMQLAYQGMIPKVLAAVVRLMTAPRSLVAVLRGAKGPLKDCGYENPIIKAIAGVPISMEGKSSACAHSSPLGNIAAAACDLWSNESVQQVRLLGGFAPEVFAEILIYDCRLMNTASEAGQAAGLRDLLVASDRYRDPQALVLAPPIIVEAGTRLIAAGTSPYDQTLAMARYAVEVLQDAVQTGLLDIRKKEQHWLARLARAVIDLPADAEALRSQVDERYGDLYLPEAYGL